MSEMMVGTGSVVALAENSITIGQGLSTNRAYEFAINDARGGKLSTILTPDEHAVLMGIFKRLTNENHVITN